MEKIKANPYLKELTCLYVEDDEFIRDSFSMLIKRYFKEIIVAKNGKEGLEEFKKNRIDIIISDIRMPVMDGIEMTRQIKEINPEIFVIFITAFSDVEYLKEAIDLGVEGYITKPIDKNKLLLKLNQLAEFLKHKRENEKNLFLLKEIFNRLKEPMVLIEKDKIKMENEKFKKIFNISSFEELKEIVGDFENDKSIKVNECLYKIRVEKLKEDTLLITFIDITEFEEEIFTDALTKVFNRKILPIIVKKRLTKRCCVIMLDIDNFKKINDTYGHSYGDEVLKYISSTLKSSLRRYDTIIRWGGEEFLIILDGVEEIDVAKKIAEMLRQKIASRVFEEMQGSVTCSFGVCCDEVNDKEDFDKLVKRADEALYKAKREGKNRVESC